MATSMLLARFKASSCLFRTGCLKGAVARYFSDDKGRILSEEERAAENVYIQKMEREKMEKMKKKAEKEKAGQGKHGAAKTPPEGQEA